MTTITITIPVVSDWPTSEELARRNKIKEALDTAKVGQCTGAGGGLGEMHLSYRIDDNSFVPAARAKIETVMARHAVGIQYTISAHKEPARTFQVKVGDVFAIPLADKQFAMGVCRFVFQRMKGLTACQIFGSLLPGPQFVWPLPAAIAFDPLFVWDHSLANGAWPIVGNIQIEPGPLMYRSAGGIYNGDEYLRADDYMEDLPTLYLPGPVAIEIELRDHFGLSPLGNGPGET
jgi:hypothetical protein